MDQYGYTSGLAIVETLRSMRPEWAIIDPLLTTMGTSYPSVIDNMPHMSQYGDLRTIVGQRVSLITPGLCGSRGCVNKTRVLIIYTNYSLS